jgi:methylated-DNA-[protein]-cysteine S-methyltransferase
MDFDLIDTPIGPLLVAADDAGLRHIFFPRRGTARRPEDGWVRDGRRFGELAAQLAEYFDGTRRVFELRLAPRGTEFQLATWRALTEIPYGTTLSYGELARRLGRPGASRAVGAANGANPLPIVVPCHRVIGADGSLTGFGGGLPIKRTLLELEKAACVAPARQLPLLDVGTSARERAPDVGRG